MKAQEKIRDILDKYAEILDTSESLGTTLSQELELVKDMRAEHPEYVEDFFAGGEREGMNPRLHIICETIVQVQIAKNDPPEARKAHLALTTEVSIDAHEARHAVGGVFLTTIWHASREKWQSTQIDSYYRRRLEELARRKLDNPGVWTDLEHVGVNTVRAASIDLPFNVGLRGSKDRWVQTCAATDGVRHSLETRKYREYRRLDQRDRNCGHVYQMPPTCRNCVP